MLNGKKVALITGITGQDGSYLSELLLSKGYYVRGIVRRSSNHSGKRIEHLLKKMNYSQDPSKEFVCYHADLTDASSLRNILEKVQPDEIYNLAAQSHVGISFENPSSTFDINALGTLRLLDAIHHSGLKCKYYQASSSEMFGTSPPPQNEETHFKPVSPYGISKVAAFNFTRMYRNAYGLFASNGILFNHECVSENTPIIIKNKTTNILSIKRIKDLRRPIQKGANLQQWLIDNIEIWDGDNFVNLNLITATKRKKDDENFKCKIMNTRNGIVEATNHHNMIQNNGNKIKALNIEIGEKLLHKDFPSSQELSVLSREEAIFLGIMVGDGSISKENKGRVTNNDKKIIDLVRTLWRKISLGNVRISEYKTEYGRATQIDLQGNSNYLRLIKNEIYTHDGFKKVPDRILNASKEDKLAFLMGYNLTDGLKSNPCTYEFKNFKTNSIILAQGLLFLIKQTTKQEFNITFDSDEKYYGYYSINLLSPTDNLEKEETVSELLSTGISQREIYAQTGISRTFISKIQHGGHAQLIHHLSKEKTEVKKVLYHAKQPEWVFDLETESGKFMAGVGNIVLSNSPRRGINFATRKITREMARIIIGEASQIVMGNLDAKRDWGLSKEYVWAMWKILQHHEPDDFVIATEETHTVREFLDEAFSLLGLDYKNYVSIDEKYKRPAEVPALLGDATKAKKILGWNPQVKFKDLVYTMVEADLKEQFEEKGIALVDPENKNPKGFYINRARELLENKAKNLIHS